MKQALDDDAPNKFIVIHLSGSHFNYKYRYPEESAIFEKNDTNGIYRLDKLSQSEIRMINEYDNSIYYTSMIIKSIIDCVKKYKSSSYILYLSDHGQQLFETEGSFQAQHAFGETQYMYNVPFFAWFSDSYKRTNSEFVANMSINTNTFSKLNSMRNPPAQPGDP